MAFTPILNDRYLAYAYNGTHYRNFNRENAWGEPVYFTPYNAPLTGEGSSGFGGPRYKQYYNYTNCPQPEKSYNGNCTWWCAGRLRETEGKHIINLIGGSWDAYEWYDKFTGTKYLTANNAVPGDIIVFKGGKGHVMFIEKVENGTLYISHSAWSTLDYWNNMACRVNSYSVSDIYAGNSVNIYKGSNYTNYMEIVGIIHTGSGGSPQPTPTDLTINIVPASYNVTMDSRSNYVDFVYDITISGIPEGETVSGGNTWDSPLYRVQNTGWTYINYYVNGVIYRRATKTQTLRYEREYIHDYTTTKRMYFNITKSTGSINTSTPMTINVRAKTGFNIAILGCKKRKRFTKIIK